MRDLAEVFCGNAVDVNKRQVLVWMADIEYDYQWLQNGY